MKLEAQLEQSGVLVAFPRHHYEFDSFVTYCTVCGGLNTGLPTDCPGEMMPEMLEWMVYKGEVDYHRHLGWYPIKYGWRKRG